MTDCTEPHVAELGHGLEREGQKGMSKEPQS
jgi:hypothetical protein